jgi:uncharacterized protein HemY
MKRLNTILLLVLSAGAAAACPVCERNQPKVLQGVTHGAGPESQWDYLIVSLTAAVVVLTLFFSVKWLLRPGETSPQHIKNVILNNE